MNECLESLIDEFPIPQSYSRPEMFNEPFELGKVAIQLVGLSVKNAADLLVTASAAGAEQRSVMRRAYFELVERITIMEACRRSPELFDQDPEPRFWKHSKSNGVAAHTDLEQAKRSSALELIERDRILRSWYGGRAPQLIKKPQTYLNAKFSRELSRRYTLQLVQFGARPFVVGVFAFPLAEAPDCPFVFGFGARDTLAEAVSHAEAELMRRLGFLWGEKVDAAALEFSPSADYHQEFFMIPSGIEKVRHWLAGGHERPEFASLPEISGSDIEFIELPAPEPGSRFRVVKARSRLLFPLVFGIRHPYLPEGWPVEMDIHPIA